MYPLDSGRLARLGACILILREGRKVTPLSPHLRAELPDGSMSIWFDVSMWFFVAPRVSKGTINPRDGDATRSAALPPGRFAGHGLPRGMPRAKWPQESLGRGAPACRGRWLSLRTEVYEC